MRLRAIGPAPPPRCYAAARHAQNRCAHADAAELLERALRLLENVDT
jgi:hypothetical protein